MSSVSRWFDSAYTWILHQVGGFSWHQLVPLGVGGVLVWSLWVYRAVMSRFAHPVVSDFRSSVSVVVPSYREDPEILLRCLRSWLAQEPDEIIIVLDVGDLDCRARLRAVREPTLRVIIFEHQGKRSALGVGIRAAGGEIVVLADSDTSWQPGLLEAVQMPFADRSVGAVGTQQNVYQRGTSVWRRIADWLVNLRYHDYVPAMSRKGAVVCVSGRTAAYRRSVLMPVLSNMEHEFFLGRRCLSGDDGRLTWLVLASGYRTVHQSSARAVSMFPDTFRAFCKQRIRWSRNSYRCYLTAVWKGWLWHVPFVSKITVLQILLTPVTMGLAVTYLTVNRLQFTPQGIGLAAAWLLIGRGVRGFSHLRRHPAEVLLLPLVALVVIFIALPIKTYAFVTMNRHDWMTRSSESIGAEAQTVRTLRPEVV